MFALNSAVELQVPLGLDGLLVSQKEGGGGLLELLTAHGGGDEALAPLQLVVTYQSPAYPGEEGPGKIYL